MGLYGRTVESFAPNSIMSAEDTKYAEEQRRILERYEANVGQFGNNTAEILDIQSLLSKALLIEGTLDEIRQIDEKMQSYLKLINEYYPRLDEIIGKLGELDGITEIYDDIKNVQKPYIDQRVEDAKAAVARVEEIETRVNDLMVNFNKDTQATVELIKSYTLASVYKFSDDKSGAETQPINVENGSVLKFILKEKETFFEFSEIPPEKDVVARQVTMIIEQGTGANLANWPSTIRWSRNRIPVLSLEKGRMDVVTLMTYDQGINWFGFFNGGWIK